jgi:hypothetical protein
MKTLKKTNGEEPYVSETSQKGHRPGTANGSVGRLKPTYVEYACLIEGKIGVSKAVEKEVKKEQEIEVMMPYPISGEAKEIAQEVGKVFRRLSKGQF